jgi:hypothetical protein
MLQTALPTYTNMRNKPEMSNGGAGPWRSLGDSNPCFRRERATCSRATYLRMSSFWPTPVIRRFTPGEPVPR